MNSRLTQLPKIQKLSQRVTSILGCNPSIMTLLGTNTYLVGTGQEKILIDTGEGNIQEYCSLLKNVLDSTSSYLKMIIITHWHHDHIGGLADVRNLVSHDVPTYKFKSPSHSRSNLPKKWGPIEYIQDKHIFKVAGASLTAHLNPGHTDDHMILWMEEEKAIFSADSILGEGTTVFENLHQYMQSLEDIRDMKPDIIYPGHGPVISAPTSHIDYYITHRKDRENQVLSCMHKGIPISAAEIVKVIYRDYPTTVYPKAESIMLLHLEKLLVEGTVWCKDERRDANSSWVLTIRSCM